MRTLKKIVQGFLHLFGYKFASTYDSVIDEDKVFIGMYKMCKAYTMTPKERMYALYKAVEYIVKAGIPGDFVECGVWKGGSSMIIARTLLALGVKDRAVYLYDTYEGMPAQTEEDYHVEDKMIREFQTSDASLDEVKANMRATGYPEGKIIFIKGKVEETIPRTISKQIALLRLDTDWYESTRHELQYLFPLIARGGVLLIDDYGAWAGAKKAVDEYCVKTPLLLTRIDHDSRIAIKA